MCRQWHRMDRFIPAQLTCRPQLYYTFPILEDFSYGQWMWEACSNEQHLLSMSWCSAWEHRLCFLHCILTLFFSFITQLPLWFKIFSHYMITDSAAPTNRCRHLSTALQLSKIASTLHPQTLSGKIPSHIIPGLSKPKQYTEIYIQASVLSILCHDRHWTRRNTDLCDTAKCYSTMFTFMYDHPLWWKSH